MNADAITLWGEVVMEAPFPMTQEEFNRRPGDGWRYELVAGKLIRMPMNGGGHLSIAITLAVAFVAQCGHLGYGLAADTSFIGVMRGWIVWPARRRIEVWRPGDTVPTIEELDMADILAGEEVAPFAIPMHKLF